MPLTGRYPHPYGSATSLSAETRQNIEAILEASKLARTCGWTDQLHEHKSTGSQQRDQCSTICMYYTVSRTIMIRLILFVAAEGMTIWYSFFRWNLNNLGKLLTLIWVVYDCIVIQLLMSKFFSLSLMWERIISVKSGCLKSVNLLHTI